MIILLILIYKKNIFGSQVTNLIEFNPVLSQFSHYHFEQTNQGIFVKKTPLDKKILSPVTKDQRKVCLVVYIFISKLLRDLMEVVSTPVLYPT